MMTGILKTTIDRDRNGVAGELEVEVEYEYDRAEGHAEITRVGLAEAPLGWSGGDEWQGWDYSGEIDLEAMLDRCMEHAEMRLCAEADRRRAEWHDAMEVRREWAAQRRAS